MIRSTGWIAQGTFKIQSVGLLLVGLFLTTSSVATPQTAPAVDQASPSAGDDLSTVLQEGYRLEAAKQWQQAIQHYERWLRGHRDAVEIERRLQICRIHHDILRRYSDGTFLQLLANSSLEQSLDLYSEILNKLEWNYVDALALPELLRYGTASLEVALTEQDFLSRHLPRIPQASSEHFRLNIHREVLGRPVQNPGEARSIVHMVANKAHQELGIPPVATVMEYVAGAVGLLDPYSGYMTAGELSEMMSQIDGNLIGLGVELLAEQDELKVIEVFEKSPASIAGLQPGDRILAIDDSEIAVISAKRGADLLRGPENSKVRLKLNRTNGTSTQVEVIRKRVEVPSVIDVGIADPESGIGYLRISNFQKTTPHEVDQALDQLSNQGMNSLIIDLRRNPGGVLEAAVEVADRFLLQGPIVSTRGRSRIENRQYDAQAPDTSSIPLTLLIDGDSASASELLAGALRDHRRATLVGTRTYGKGSVQGLFHTDTLPGGLRLTVSKFFSPSGHMIHLQGVDPDLSTQPANDPTGGKTVQTLKPSSAAGNSLLGLKHLASDVTLQKAVEVARRQRSTIAQAP